MGDTRTMENKDNYDEELLSEVKGEDYDEELLSEVNGEDYDDDDDDDNYYEYNPISLFSSASNRRLLAPAKFTQSQKSSATAILDAVFTLVPFSIEPSQADSIDLRAAKPEQEENLRKRQRLLSKFPSNDEKEKFGLHC